MSVGVERASVLCVLSLALVAACSDGQTPAAGGSAGSAGATSSTPSAGTASVAGSAGSTMSAGTSSGGSGGGGASSGSGGASLGGAGAGGGGASNGGGGAGGAAGSGGSSTAGAGGADPEGWVDIFNGQDLTNWVPLIHKSAYNEDEYHTFRADPVNHVIKVTYVDYPNHSFDDRCGLLYYNKPLTNYRVRATYHFVDEAVEPQAKNPVSWGRFNSGLMIFGIDPSKVTGDPEFPPLIEIQLLGEGSAGGSTSPNICTPGGMVYDKGADCGNNGSGVKPAPPTTWVTVEAEVHPGAQTKVYTYPPGKPDRSKPIEIVTGVKYQNSLVTNGYLSIQSESQPCEFKDIQIIELPN
ncbi:MAG TPA: DUF1080 domain-containing protein [Polyangiaceae bacterium]|nr:DUF1080 domain-containing protein [Polyangiaceae bacterium]